MKNKIFEEDNKNRKLISPYVEKSSNSFVFGSSKEKLVWQGAEIGLCDSCDPQNHLVSSTPVGVSGDQLPRWMEEGF